MINEVGSVLIYWSFFYYLNFIGLVKPLHIMANIELRLLDCTNKKRYIKTEVAELYSKSVIKIDIYDLDTCRIIPVLLDKSTAIKFAKTLRTEINKIQE